MSKQPRKQRRDSMTDLRSRAERRLKDVRNRRVARATLADLQKVIHELEVSQIELEIQNEELRQAQSELEASRSRFEDLYEFAPVGYLTLDERGVVDRANLRACAILGVERRAVVGKPLRRLIPGAPAVLQPVDRTTGASKSPQIDEIVVNHPDGQERTLRIESLVRTVEEDGSQKRRRHERRISLSDITPQRIAERRVRDQDARLRGVLQAVPDGVLSADSKARIETFNAEAEQIFGYTVDEVVGKHIGILLAPPQRHELEKYLTRYAKGAITGPINIRGETAARHKSGETIPVDVAIVEVQDDGPHFIASVRDVSERYRLHQQIADGVTQTQEGIARDLHDGIAQLVTGIELTAAVLHDGLSGSRSENAEMAERLLAQARTAQQEVRAVIKGVHLHAVPAGDLEAVLRDLAKELKPVYGVRGAFERRGETKASDTQTATQLNYIAREAVFNAVKHADAKRITIALGGDEKRLTLTVRDDGRGVIKPRSSSGLGLGIMRYRANLIGADLAVRSTKAGTVVTCSVERRTKTTQG